MNVTVIAPAGPLRELRLEDAVREAEALGRVSMEQSLFDTDWNVGIAFKNRSSYIFAKSKDRSLVIALGKCIDEARGLGAGVPP